MQMSVFPDTGFVKGGPRDEVFWMGKFIEKVGEEKANSYVAQHEKLKATPSGYREEIVNGRKRKIDVSAAEADAFYQTLILEENCSERIMKTVFRIGSQRFARLKNGVGRKAPGGVRLVFSKKQEDSFVSFIASQCVSIKICRCPARIMKAYLIEDIPWEVLATRFSQHCETTGNPAVSLELFMKYKNRFFPQLFLKRQLNEDCNPSTCSGSVSWKNGGSSKKELLITAWSLLTSPVKHSDSAAVKRLLNDIGVTEAQELQYCTPEDIEMLATHLKAVPKKSFLNAMKAIKSTP